MTEGPAPQIAPLALAEIERRLQWRAMPVIMFVCILSVLLGTVLWPHLVPPPHLVGLPDDPDVFAAALAVRGRVALPPGELRFRSSLTGPLAPGARPAADEYSRLGHARRLLERARPRLGGDPRWMAARAALDLVGHRYDVAERHYRQALERSTNYPEARLGLGLALALEAEIERHPLTQRRRLLEAIAQLAAVPRTAPESEDATFDRVLLLERVGRRVEAASLARMWLAREPGGPGSERMREIGTAGGD